MNLFYRRDDSVDDDSQPEMISSRDEVKVEIQDNEVVDDSEELRFKEGEKKQSRRFNCVDSTILYYVPPQDQDMDDKSDLTRTEESKESYEAVERKSYDTAPEGESEDDSTATTQVIFFDHEESDHYEESKNNHEEESVPNPNTNETDKSSTFITHERNVDNNNNRMAKTPTSVRAGERLYNQAMQRIHRLESLKRESHQASAKSNISTAVSSSTRAGERLYNEGTKRMQRMKSLKKESNHTNVTTVGNLSNRRLCTTPQRLRGIADEDDERSTNTAPPSYMRVVEKGQLMTDDRTTTTSSSSSSSSSSYHSSIVAGNRLFNQAMERFERLDAIKRKGQEVPQVNLTLHTTRRNTKCSSRSRSSVKPRYLHLYEQSKVKSRRQGSIESPVSSTSSDRSTNSNSSDNSSFDRLYNLSYSQQLEGKKRREEIAKASRAREEIPCLYMNGKISPKEAEKLYYRGIRHLIDLDIRRIESARIHQSECQPHRFNKNLAMRALQIDYSEELSEFEILIQ